MKTSMVMDGSCGNPYPAVEVFTYLNCSQPAGELHLEFVFMWSSYWLARRAALVASRSLLAVFFSQSPWGTASSPAALKNSSRVADLMC